jgi:hypothetical protein
MADDPGVDVVIVAFNSVREIPEVIASVGNASRITVVDHAGDGSAEAAIVCGAEAVTDQANPGFGAGQNRGASSG